MDRRDSRSNVAVGMDWAARATTLGLEFVLPALLGVAIDRRWKTGYPVATVLGAVVGFAIGMMHVLRIARGANRP